MKKLIKKLLILTIIAAMVVTAMPLTGIDLTDIFTLKADAAVSKERQHLQWGDYAYYPVGEKGEGYCEIIKYLGSDTNIVVPETIDGWTVKVIKFGAFVDDTELTGLTDKYWINENLENITSVVLPETVTSINGAFQNLKKLKSINMPKNLQSLHGSFRGCENLEKIELPEGFEYLGSYTFENTAITELILPDSLKHIYANAFCGMKIKELTLPESISNFYSHTLYCESLETLTIKGEIENVWNDAFKESASGTPSYPEKIIFLQAPRAEIFTFTDIYDFSHNFENGYWEFIKKKPLTDVFTYGNFEYILNANKEAIITNITQNYPYVTVPESVSDEEYIPVVEIGNSAFVNKIEIYTVSLPKTVKKIGARAFAGCYNMHTISLSEIEYLGARTFSGCKKLANVTLPDIKYIEPGTFEYCESLTTIHIPESVKEICPDAFLSCKALKTVTGCEGLEKIGAYAFKDSTVETVPFCKGLKEIGIYAFHFSKINDVTLPEGFEKIGAYAFENAYNFSKLILPETVKEIGDYAFNSCKIEELHLPNGLESLGKYSFRGTLISSLYIPFTLIEIPDYAFSNCNNLVVINVPSNIKRVGNYAFGSQMTLFAGATITIAEGVEEICANAFRGKITDELTIPESVKTMSLRALSGLQLQTLNYNAANAFLYTTDGSSSLLYQTGTKTVNFGNNVKSVPRKFAERSEVEMVIFSDSIEHIGEYAFSECKKLKEISLPKNLKTVDDFAFYCCDLPTEVVFPDSVISLGERAFGGCDGLAQITLPQNVEIVGKWAFYSCESEQRLQFPKMYAVFHNSLFNGAMR